jgi:three-Cys-motif partner protein
VPTKRTSERYEIDPSDGLRREVVGQWVREKHLRLRRYVDITRATRRKFGGNSTFIDLYCGPGRCWIKDTGEAIEGSAVLAATEARERDAFGKIHIGDLDQENLSACTSRLHSLGITNVTTYLGPAAMTAAEVIRTLSPTGLHLAFLDPYSIDALPFSVISTLAQLKRMDLIIHVSLMDLQRNLREKMRSGRLDAFAPGWKNAVDQAQRGDLTLLAVFAHWRKLLVQMGYQVSDNIERVSGSKNQPLYWLVLAGRHKLADKFWSEVSHVEPQGRLSL